LKTFHCTACQALVFFENSRCLNCDHLLAFVPAAQEVCALDQHDDGSWWPANATGSSARAYKLCKNYVESAVCNWVLPADSAEALCDSCRWTGVIPDLSVSGNVVAWAKLETAKRRLMYALQTLKLPLISKREDAERGLEFRFLSDAPAVNGDRSRVMTGHDNGVITINVAEADDIYREGQRLQNAEPYRTLLGHFRHEIGHYYWDQLVAPGPRLEAFRTLFGDERGSYSSALERHYAEGPPADWAERYISAYASMHPWEDWAETWAHVMHMVDALETAHFVGLSIRPRRSDEPALSVPQKPPQARVENVDELIKEWSALTYVLNNLTRGLGLADAYPFVLSPPVVDKLRFVCATMSKRT
jgi:hypothetical protein